MTLIETVAALAVTALLAAGALSATRALVRTRITVGELGRQDQLAPALARLLEMDLIHARQYRCRDGCLELESLATLEGADLRLAHRPVAVAYRAVVAEGQSNLVRIQRPADGRVTAELVLRGGRSIQLRKVADKDLPRDWRPVPDTAAISVAMDDQAGVNVEMVLVLR